METTKKNTEIKTVAEQLEKLDFTEALITADKKSIKAEQDFENETTVFVFEDSSKLKFSSIEYTKVLC
jgi:hypothetical protein